MKIFISWSGQRSKKVAELLEVWVKCVIQAVDPWVSSNGIDRGALWFSAISSELANTSVGIVCLTKENKDKPWILFESGALAKGLDSNLVCTFLIDLKSSDLESPLSQFNHTTPDKTGVFALVKTINYSLNNKALGEKILENVFETYWPQFESSFKRIIEETPEVTVIKKRTENEIMLEILSSVRSFEKRITSIEAENIKHKASNSIDTKIKPAFKWNVVENFENPLADFGTKIKQRISDLVEQGMSEDEAQKKVLAQIKKLSSASIIWPTAKDDN